MGDFAESRAVLLRSVVGAESVGGPKYVAELLTWLGGFVELGEASEGKGTYRRRGDGGAALRVPHCMGCWESTHAILHELGHALMDLPPPETIETGWLAQGHTRLEEEEVERFRRCFVLPRDLTLAVCRGNETAQAQFAHLVGMDLAEIRAHAAWLLSHPAPDLDYPLPWSAAVGCWVGVARVQGERGLILTLPGGTQYGWLCHTEGEVLATHHFLISSLRALRPHEFALQCASHRLEFEELQLFGARPRPLPLLLAA